MQSLKKNTQSVGLHVAYGEFSKALELLQKQLGIHDFSKLKQQFVDLYTLNSLKMATLPHAEPLEYRLRFVDRPIVTLTFQTI
jgi:hypothetical protein